TSNEPSTISNVFKPPEKQVGRDGPINSVKGQTGGSGEIKVEASRGRGRGKQPYDHNPKPNKMPRPEQEDSNSGINTANEDSNLPPLRITQSTAPLVKESNENMDITDQF
ncbi:hypothetical protein BpHYR1_023629, partial [Brachionus plicatilis]